MTVPHPLYEREPLLFGLTPPGLPQTFELNEKVYEDLIELQKLGESFGITIEAISTWRGFEKQKEIWNAKARGEKALLNDQGVALNFETLSDIEIIHAILRWSAFPGLSRHHWGTDLDIIDQTGFENYLKKEPSYKIELVPSEYEKSGPFEELGKFLNGHLSKTAFFRPYVKDLGGVAREPWHLSHRLALSYFEKIKVQDFLDFLHSDYCEDIELVDTVKKNSKEIFKRYFLAVTNGP